MSVLPDHVIRKFAQYNGMVNPFREPNLQPASLDLCLSDEFIVFDDHNQVSIDLANMHDISPRKTLADEGFVLHPGQFVLGATEEIVNIPSHIVARLEGKSSIGRLGILIHVTAGYIDPGFCGRLTLEIYNLRNVPVILIPGLPFCQISFQSLYDLPERTYSGRYQNDMEVVSSRYGKRI